MKQKLDNQHTDDKIILWINLILWFIICPALAHYL